MIHSSYARQTIPRPGRHRNHDGDNTGRLRRGIFRIMDLYDAVWSISREYLLNFREPEFDYNEDRLLTCPRSGLRWNHLSQAATGRLDGKRRLL